MPTYVYQIIHEDGSEGESFEVFQSIHEKALTVHPESGQKIRRVLQPVYLNSKHTEGKSKQVLSDGNIEKHGFTRYEKDSSGQYKKTAGSGPDSIQP